MPENTGYAGRRKLERHVLLAALESAGWSQKGAARKLKCSPRKVRLWIDKYGILSMVQARYKKSHGPGKRRPNWTQRVASCRQKDRAWLDGAALNRARNRYGLDQGDLATVLDTSEEIVHYAISHPNTPLKKRLWQDCEKLMLGLADLEAGCPFDMLSPIAQRAIEAAGWIYTRADGNPVNLKPDNDHDREEIPNADTTQAERLQLQAQHREAPPPTMARLAEGP